MTDALLASLDQVVQLQTIAMMLLGIAIGFLVGILPGLGGAVTLALMLPFTFNMDPIPAFALLLGMYVVTATTGDLTSILFGVPGEATSAAVVLDGYPLTRRGQAGRALGAALASSAVGAIFGAVVLALSVPIVRPLVLQLGPPEFFGLALLALTFVVILAGRDLYKGLIMACLGLLVALVGMDPVDGVPRYTFGEIYLWDGIDIIPVVVGLFGGAEVLQLMLSKTSVAQHTAPSDVHRAGTGAREALRHWSLVLRSSAIGTGVGLVPGLGGSVAQFIAYGHAKQTSKHPEEFGNGSIEGVIAASATNNAKDSGSLIPTIAFGIPGSAGSAVLLSAFLIVGLDPGFEMLTNDLDVTFSMVWITVAATLISTALAFAVLRPLTKLVHIPGQTLVPFLLLFLCLGAYSSTNSFGDVLVMLAFGALGVACIHFNWPRVPLLLGIVLGDIAERYFFLSYSLFGWSWLTRPIFLGIAVLIVLALGLPWWRERRNRRRELSKVASK
ncbi:tripartite tricarboxylate transporter permease [Saccharopolyspora sp. K220]|uniref:tripartite tricarboxylate transporter permease n=1 Tax=Saccharopolyspora soli TaxID=2926618 RepID=UPI001F59FA9B|nr:tripartite tricarboxylate transporter permease [Saccharopolyspora soli]MCI2418388.1 tripartite tricarboxylate transporter permease [Saccharopolyspora soli]